MKRLLLLGVLSLVLSCDPANPPIPEEPREDGGPGECVAVESRACWLGPPAQRGVGECREGNQLCGGDGTWEACLGEGGPSVEVCNGRDDDCDGETDEAISGAQCGVGACLRTVSGCFDGGAPVCAPGPSSNETCNGIDDDCDGQTDESLGMLSCGAGECARSVAACVSGVGQTCTAGTPGVESCNNLDDDCDGQTDEGTLSCGVGQCARTVPACVGGAAGTCMPGSMATETCNALDDDCDGSTDESLAPLACTDGICSWSAASCLGGISQSCTAAPPGESCNGIDDDCDGQTDEGNPGGGMTCQSGQQGACAQGTTICSGSALSCQANAGPTPEVCTNGLDEDCDGTPDDGCP